MSELDLDDVAAQSPLAMRELTDLRDEAARLRSGYESVCALVTRMHCAATGSNDGPSLGVVEDVAEVRKDAERWRWIRAHGSWPETESWASDAAPGDFDKLADEGMGSDAAILSTKDAKARTDAERYRWLRDIGSKTWSPLAEQWRLTAVQCDAAIDRESAK